MNIAGILAMVTSHETIECPHCGHREHVSDTDVSLLIVSYWGDDRHEYSCSECASDYVLNERVIRQYDIAKTHKELDDL